MHTRGAPATRSEVRTSPGDPWLTQEVEPREERAPFLLQTLPPGAKGKHKWPPMEL